jgi:hypothetical protein
MVGMVPLQVGLCLAPSNCGCPVLSSRCPGVSQAARVGMGSMSGETEGGLTSVCRASSHIGPQHSAYLKEDQTL